MNTPEAPSDRELANKFADEIGLSQNNSLVEKIVAKCREHFAKERSAKDEALSYAAEKLRDAAALKEIGLVNWHEIMISAARVCEEALGQPPDRRSAKDEREGFYEKLWKDFCSIQRGDVTQMCRDAENYRRLQGGAKGQEPIGYIPNRELAMLQETGFCHAELSTYHARKDKTAIYLSAPAIPADHVTWGIDWGRDGDRSCASIVKKHDDGTLEIVATGFSPEATGIPANQWSPIETAPIRTDILCWNDTVGFWVGRIYPNLEPDDPDATTHWMPLPAAPQTKEPT